MAAAQAIGIPEVLEGDLSRATDEELLWAARAGNDDAFVELSGRYSTFVRSKIYQILRNREDAEDALQEAILRAFSRLDQFRGSSRFSTWFIRIAINQALMLLRKRRISAEISYDMIGEPRAGRDIWELADHAPSPEMIYVKTEVEERLQGAVQRLPTSFRSIVDLFHGEDYSMQETAEALGISLAAAKSRLMRARLTLRRCSNVSVQKPKARRPYVSA